MRSKILFLSLLLSSFISSWAAPYTFDADGFSFYCVIPPNVTVVGCSHTGDVTIPAKVLVGDVEYTVTSIGGGFRDRTDITSITISNGIETIGDYAFQNCTALSSVSIPSSVKTIGSAAFNGCSSLTQLSLPESLETIGSSAFTGTAITNVTLPAGVTSFDGAFSGCTKLESVTLEEGLSEISGSAFENCTALTSVSIPSGVTRIEDYAFRGCTSMQTLSIPSTVNYFGTYVFTDCTGILNINCSVPGPIFYDFGTFYGAKFTEVNFGDQVTSIGKSAFSGCSTITTVTLGQNVETIDINAFSGCTGLQALSFPSSLKTISDGAFCGCKSLKSVNIGSALQSLGSNAFKECFSLSEATIASGTIGAYAFEHCDSLKTLTLGEGVTTIGEGAFQYCGKLSNVVLSNHLTTIGSAAFYDCSQLASITIPSSVTSIGQWAFSGCTGKAIINCNIVTDNGSPYSGAKFSEVVIGSGVTSIGNQAFRGMNTITSLSLPDGLLTIGDYAFSDCSLLTSVAIPSSVGYIGSSAFARCGNMVLTDNTVLSCEIGSYAFSGCSSLTSVALGKNVSGIGVETFRNCNNLKTVTVDEEAKYLTYIGYYAFYECEALEHFDFPACLDSIGYGAFKGCTSLREITLPEGLRILSSDAFHSCTGTTSVTIPSTLEKIGGGCFNFCRGTAYINCNVTGANYAGSWISFSEFSSLVFGENVTTLCDMAFWKCDKVRDVTVFSTTPIEIGPSTFPTRTYSTLHCPNGGKFKYLEADYWKEFQNILTPEFAVIYKVDGEVYHTDSVELDAVLTPIAIPEKEGYVFSGWSEMPEVMPKHDVVVEGHFIQPVTVRADSLTMVYGDEVPTLTYTSEGAELTGVPTLSCDATSLSPVGEYVIHISKGTVTNTYDTYVNGILTITKAPLTVSVGNYTREERKNNPEFTIVYSGWKNDDTESVLLSKPIATTTATIDSPAGDYPITLSGGETQNYTFNYVNGVLTVTQQTTSVETLTAKNQTFDVYSTMGILLRRNATSLKGLSKGTYLISKPGYSLFRKVTVR